MCALRQHTGDLYPYALEPLLLDKVWGGTRLGGLFCPGRTERRLGEAWVVWDRLPITNGPLRGATLADRVRAQPALVLGSQLAEGPSPPFPLLVKLVEAQEALSVQVHPDDGYAQAHEGEPFGKAEAWYVLDAEPGAWLSHGVRRRVERAEMEEAIAGGTLDRLLRRVVVRTGDVILNPPGTIHSLGPGLLLYELQQSSDLTYRLYDWARNDPGRPLHLDKALDVATLEPQPLRQDRPEEAGQSGGGRQPLCCTSWFAAELLSVTSSVTEQTGGRCFHALTVLEGSGAVLSEGGVSSVPLVPGASLLIPAGLHAYEIRAGAGPLAVIKAFVPEPRPCAAGGCAGGC